MKIVITGMALGLIVSIPPGPNAALCMSLACEGTRRAMPLITGAALADSLYSLLAASGVLVAVKSGFGLLAYLTPCFMLATAALVRAPARLDTRVALGVPLLNPSTAAIWLGLSSLPAMRALNPSDILLRPLPVALGTAVWFTLLAALAPKFSNRLKARHSTMRTVAAAMLACYGVFSLVSVLVD